MQHLDRLVIWIWARWMLARKAVVIDTETTTLHGRLCEVAVVDLDGQVLFEHLVDPCEPISAEASAVHGLVDRDVADQPTAAAVLPYVVAAIGRRPILAYNADYDYGVLRAEASRAGVRLGRAGRRRSWGCLMRARGRAEGQGWVRLNGGHRASGDAIAAVGVLRVLAGKPMRSGHCGAL